MRYIAPKDASELAAVLYEIVGRASDPRSTTPLRVLLTGAPGTGKTMFTRRLAFALPPLTETSDIETAWIHYGAGLCSPWDLTGRFAIARKRPPFRAPHHTISQAALTGSAANGRVRPGELSLAHAGVLMLDELAEFRPKALKATLQLANVGHVGIGDTTLPARPRVIVGTTNPCPCGFRHVATRNCACEESAIKKYRARVDAFLPNVFVSLARLEHNAVPIFAAQFQITAIDANDYARDVLNSHAVEQAQRNAVAAVARRMWR